jgi:hypothetical protein
MHDAESHYHHTVKVKIEHVTRTTSDAFPPSIVHSMVADGH